MLPHPPEWTRSVRKSRDHFAVGTEESPRIGKEVGDLAEGKVLQDIEANQEVGLFAVAIFKSRKCSAYDIVPPLTG